MGKHRWPTAGEDWAPPRGRDAASDGLEDPGAVERDDASGVSVEGRAGASVRRSRRDRRVQGADEGGSDERPGIQWRIARSAALVFLGVALAVGTALFLVRSSEPSSAAVSVELTGPRDAGPSGAAGETGSAARGPDAETGSGADGQRPEDEGPGGETPGDDKDAGGPVDGVEDTPVLVYVTGAVEAPGVISVRAGTRLVDVIDKAGGALPEADLERINLASSPADGQHIHLSVVGEEPQPDGVLRDGAPPQPATAEGSVSGRGGSAGAAPGAIDINSAALGELETLPRVGPVLGQRIIDWREENGPFAEATDIDAVPGIGPAMLEGILPLVVAR